ncbi:MAG: permease-like cell division protein FtsX [Clostridia bacterium]|nr:permease-like cell division protein FtsX [Clostridia bacterium]
MKGASLKYLTKEGFRNVWVNRLMSLASVSVLMACLVIIGLGAMIFFNIDALLDTIERQNVVMVYVDKGATDEQSSQVGNQLKTMNNIDECIFVPKEDALQAQIESMGADAVLFEGLKENPLPDAYKVVIKDLTQFKATVDDIKKIDFIDTVRENSDVADKLIGIRKGVSAVIIGMVSLLFIVSLFIISNTIRITMFSRKLEISIMKAVGATNWFIRWPFMIEGMLLGVISGLFSFGVLAGLYRGMVYVFNDVLPIFTPVAFGNYAGYILLVFMAIGIFTGSFGSIISMGKYLKEQGSVVSEE